AVVLEGETEAAEEALEKPDGRRAGIDLHVEDARLQGLGQEVDLRLDVVVADEDVGGLRGRQRTHVTRVNDAVAGKIEPEPAHRVDGDAVVGRAAGIVGVVDIAALAAHDLRRDALYRVHCQLQWVVVQPRQSGTNSLKFSHATVRWICGGTGSASGLRRDAGAMPEHTLL